MTRNYFSKKNIGPYFVSDHITDKEKDVEVSIELFVYRVLRIALFIPRRFWAGILALCGPFVKGRKRRGI